MTNTKDVVVRAQVCVRCHVGSQEADVNHDLIAAGHPRLRFEYGAYLANYPSRHWKVAADHERYGDFEARAWLVGQVVSAKAALELLEYRANPKHRKPWPEFAEYSCFACHHELKDQEWRRKPNAGQLPWGTWYFAQRKIVAGSVRDARPGDLKLFDELAQLMAKNDPQIIKEATNAVRVLDRWTSDLAQGKCRNKKSLESLLAALTREDEETDWDRAAQRYLGIAAVYNALGDVDANYRQDGGLKNDLHRLADLLNGAFFSKTEPRVKYESPRYFEPDLLRQPLNHLREQLRRHGVE